MAFPVSPTEGQTHTENNTVWIYSAVMDQWNRSVINPLNETTYIGSDGAPGGIGGNTQVIFNDNGSLASDAGLVYNKTTDALTAGSLRTTSLGTAAAPGIAFETDPNTGIYSPGADQLAVSTGGTQRLTVDTAATTSTLPVVHPLGAVGTPSITFTGDLNTGFYRPTADTLAAVTAGANRLHITSGGLVGIGTSAPADALHVVGDAQVQATGTNASLITVKSGRATSTSANQSTIRFRDSSNNILATVSCATQVGNAQGNLHVYTANTSDDGNVNLSSFTFSKEGRLGIGTTSPSSLLHLADAGNIQVGTTTGTKIGTATTQKLGFYNATPVVQPAAVANATTAVDVITQLNDLLAKLRTLGIIAT